VDDRDELRYNPPHHLFASALARGDERRLQRIGRFWMLATRGSRTFGDVSPACGRRDLFDIGPGRQERHAQDGDRPQDQCQQSAHDENSSQASRGRFREGEAPAEPLLGPNLGKRLSRSFALPIAQKLRHRGEVCFIVPVRARI
jgi:hypothetical protein